MPMSCPKNHGLGKRFGFGKFSEAKLGTFLVVLEIRHRQGGRIWQTNVHYTHRETVEGPVETKKKRYDIKTGIHHGI